MSSAKLFPFSWFLDDNWKSVQITGYLENGRSVYVRIPFRPYFVVKYGPEVSGEIITEFHEYLLAETPIEKITPLPGTKYRLHAVNREQYYASLAFYTPNGPGKIIDEDQSMLNKFFAEKNIVPGLWQLVTNIQTLKYNVSTGLKFSSADLEYYAREVITIDSGLPIPQGILAFFDIEAISGDNISFPDPEAVQGIDKIFAISLVVVRPGLPLSVNSYILTDQSVVPSHRLPGGQQINITTVTEEKELLELFFSQLAKFRPDRLISMNGRYFDINYIGVRAKALNVNIYPFTKVVTYIPQFQETQLVQTLPFPLVSTVQSLPTPGVSQIDLLDVYRRLYPVLGNHRLETLARFILGRGKTGLSVSDMFAKYRRGTVADLLEIIEYSVVDSILLRDLWDKSELDKILSHYANFWRNDTEYVITTDLPILFDDLLRYFVNGGSSEFEDDLQTRYDVGKPLVTDRVSGIHTGIKLYSLNGIYGEFLRNTDKSLAKSIGEYFRQANAVIAFRSGYFPVNFSEVKNFIDRKVPKTQQIWIEENIIAVQGSYPLDPIFEYMDTVDAIVAQKSWIIINNKGMVFRKGMSNMVRPPFPLINRYIDYLIDRVKNHPGKPLVFPDLPTTLLDFVREIKISAKDFISPNERSAPIVKQLLEVGTKITPSWIKVKYITTYQGPVIDQIYNRDPEKYVKLLDIDYYNKTLQNTLSSIFKK